MVALTSTPQTLVEIAAGVASSSETPTTRRDQSFRISEISRSARSDVVTTPTSVSMPQLRWNRMSSRFKIAWENGSSTALTAGTVTAK